MSAEPASGVVHRDREMRVFYAIVAGIPLLLSIMIGLDGAWLISAAMFMISLAFLVFGWPLTAIVRDHDPSFVVFAGPVRRSRIGVDNLSSVKIVWPEDWRRHLVLRRRWRLPVSYRVDRFTEPGPLAHAILGIIEESGATVKDERALRLLRKASKRR